MRAVLQRVTRASVTVEGQVVGEIGAGLLVLVGVVDGDDPADAQALAAKIAELRVFADLEGKMNRSDTEVGGAVLDVSQFTLYGDVRRGRRPSFTRAAPPEVARPMVAAVVAGLREHGLQVEQGVFGAHMTVALVNDGPVTLVIEVEGARII
jgi:D-tyrosyl-tRNA(Tyr) deacylase